MDVVILFFLKLTIRDLICLVHFVQSMFFIAVQVVCFLPTICGRGCCLGMDDRLNFILGIVFLLGGVIVFYFIFKPDREKRR